MSNEPNKTSRQRRRRPRNRRKQKQREEELAPAAQVVAEQPNLDLNDLTRYNSSGLLIKEYLFINIKIYFKH